MKLVFIGFTCLLNLSFTFGQITIAGKIKMSPSWHSKLYLSSVESFSANPKLLDSIGVNRDGNFHYKMKEVDHKRIVYKLSIVPVGQPAYTTIDGYADNGVYLLLNDKDSCYVTARADSFYYSSKLSGNANLNDPLAVQHIKRPLFDLSILVKKELKVNPARADQIQEDFSERWMKMVDTAKSKLQEFINVTESPGGQLLGLYNLFLAGTGELDSLYTTSVIANNKLNDYYLTNDAIELIQSAEHNRIGVKLTDVSLFDTAGGKRNLYSITKDITIIDFWTRNCGPCRKANRNELKRLYSRLQNTDTAFFAISLDLKPNDWTTAMREDNIAWPCYRENMQLRILYKTLGISFVPVYLVINKGYTVVYSTSSIYHLLSYLDGVKK